MQKYTLRAREIKIIWSDHPQYWTWKRDPTLGYDVAELRSVWWLDIQATFDTAQLSERTNYEILFVYKLLSNEREVKKALAAVRLSKEMPDGTDEEGFTVFLDPKLDGPDHKGRFPKTREDGWLEIKLGDYFNNHGFDGELFMRLLDKNTMKMKTGLIVRGIELRPIE